MSAVTPEQAWPFFIGTWILLGFAGSLFFYLKNVDAALKKRLWPIFNAVVAAAFIFFIWPTVGWTTWLLLAVFFVAVGVGIRTAAITFCPFCNGSVNSRSKICRNCGHALDEVQQ